MDFDAFGFEVFPGDFEAQGAWMGCEGEEGEREGRSCGLHGTEEQRKTSDVTRHTEQKNTSHVTHVTYIFANLPPIVTLPQ